MRDKGWEYLNEIWNIFDCTSPVIYIIYMIKRITYSNSIELSYQIIQDYDSGIMNINNNIILLRVLCMAILFQSFMKSMFFLRVNDNFGHLVQLIGTCLYDVRQFMSFFFGWILFFALQYLVIGLEISTLEYPGIGFKTRAFV